MLELKDRIGPVMAASPQPGGGVWRGQVHEALLGLGWNAKAADGAVDAVAADLPNDADPDISFLLREALRTLSKA